MRETVGVIEMDDPGTRDWVSKFQAKENKVTNDIFEDEFPSKPDFL